MDLKPPLFESLVPGSWYQNRICNGWWSNPEILRLAIGALQIVYGALGCLDTNGFALESAND